MQHVILGQAFQNQSLLNWALSSLNSWSVILAMIAGTAIFAGACRLVAKRRSRSMLAAYLVLLPLPLLITVVAAIKGMISSFLVIASTPELQVTSSEFAGGMAACLFALLAALAISAPTYVVLAFGLLFQKDTPTAGFEH